MIGRFTQEDTYRGDGLNLYAYVGNNPVNAWDPSGHKIQWYQYGKAVEGIGARIKDEIEGLAYIADTTRFLADMLTNEINLSLDIANGNISLQDLLDLGIDALTEDIRCVEEHDDVRDCNTYVPADEEVFWYEYHSAGVVMDILGLLLGGEKIAVKAAEILSKSKVGKKILNVAEDIGKETLKTEVNLTRNVTKASELDIGMLGKLKNEGTISSGGRSGGNRPLTGTPNSKVAWHI